MDKNMKDLVERAAYTFVQSFIVVFLAGLANVLTAFQNGLSTGKAALLALALSALAAGLSGLKTAYLQYKAS